MFNKKMVASNTSIENEMPLNIERKKVGRFDSYFYQMIALKKPNVKKIVCKKP